MLKEVKSFFEDREGWDLDELISEMAYETNMLVYNLGNGERVSPDECYIYWGASEPICGLDCFR